MTNLIDVNQLSDILPVYRNTPIEWLIRYQNLGEPQFPVTVTAEVFVSMCIDNRKALNVQNGFAYILRTAGARLRGNEFELTFAIAIGGVSTVALIGHTDCRMEIVLEMREEFIQGLVERTGINPNEAAKHFDASAPNYAIPNPIDATIRQAEIVRRYLPNILVAPLLYRIEDDMLMQIDY
jgi:carbonic anhydrase